MPGAPDVRVRLSAEGVSEVVGAFRQIQAEAARTAKQSRLAGEGHAFLNQQLTSLKALLPTLAVGALVTGFIALAKSGLELADNLGKTQQKTQLSADTLSAWSFAARYADVEQEALSKGLVKFTKSMDDYDKGATKARGSVKDLFGDKNALQGLTMDQRLQKIMQRMVELGPSAMRTGAAITLFGKAGADLLPVMDELGAQGLDVLRERAKKLGLTFDDDALKAAENLNRSLITMKAEAQGMATQFLMGLAPNLANAANAITDATAEGGVSGFQKIGVYAGYVINGIVAAFIIVGDTIAFVLNEGRLLWDDFGNYAKDTLKGVWTAMKMGAGQVMPGGNPFLFFGKSDFERLYQPGSNQFLTRLQSFFEGTQKRVAALFAAPPEVKGKKPNPETNQPDEGKAAKAALDLAQAEADAKLKVASAIQKQQEAAERERYDKGLESLREYYAARLAIVERQGQAEVAAAQAKLDALKTAPLGDELPAERQAKIVAAQAEVDTKRIDVQTQINALKGEEARETETLQQKSLDFEKKIAKSAGDRYAQAKAAIDAEAAQLDALLRKMGVAEAERAKRVEAFRSAGYQAADFDELQRQATQAMNLLDTERERINQQVQGGLLFDFEGEQKKMALEQQRLPLLRQIADEMTRSAITPEQIQAAADFASRVDGLAVASNKAALEMANFKASVEQALTSELSNWLSSGIDQASSLGDAFRGLAASIVGSLRQIAAQMLATYLVQKLLGFLGFAAPTPVKAAGGGLIRGPGSGTSDSIPARLSNGEYVVRAAAVRQPGALELLDGLNFRARQVRRMHTPNFADGGLVDLPAGGGGSKAGLSATLDLDPALVLKRLEATPEFERVIVRTAGRNQKAMKQALGR